MDRGLIVGAVAFAVGFAAERLFASMSKDLARYEGATAERQTHTFEHLAAGNTPSMLFAL